jgi:hypothetical protein
MSRTKKKRSKSGASRKGGLKVRLKKAEALELMRIGADDPAMADRHLRMLRPNLSPEARKEVAWRCADPQARGGIETGHDPELGDYADIAVTTVSS